MFFHLDHGCLKQKEKIDKFHELDELQKKQRDENNANSSSTSVVKARYTKEQSEKFKAMSKEEHAKSMGNIFIMHPVVHVQVICASTV